MTLDALIKKVEKLEKELKEIKMPKKVLGKIFVDKKLLEKAKKALFDFDIEKFVTKKDLKSWK
jgi:uncharacterized protein (UPF0335 family)